MLNERIDHFSFCQPVVFTLSDNPGTRNLSRWGYYLGSLADQYASLSSQALQVNAECIDGRKIYFEVKAIQDISWDSTALKVASCILSLGLFLVIACMIKVVFKRHLNTCRVLTKKSPNEVISEKEIGKTRIVLLSGSVINETTEVIVNAANKHLRAGGGVCGAIHKAAGEEPFNQCQEILKTKGIKQLECGEAVITSSGDLAPRIRAIVHTVGPDYRIKKEEDTGQALLADAYRNSLTLVSQADYSSISFPSISTGIYRAPLKQSATTALKTIKRFVEENPNAFEEIRFVFLALNKDPDTAPAYEKALEELE